MPTLSVSSGTRSDGLLFLSLIKFPQEIGHLFRIEFVGRPLGNHARQGLAGWLGGLSDITHPFPKRLRLYPMRVITKMLSRRENTLYASAK